MRETQAVSARVCMRQVRSVRPGRGAMRALLGALLVDRWLFAGRHLRQGRWGVQSNRRMPPARG